MDSIKNEEKLLTRENIKYHFSVSAWIINENRTKVLLAYHKIYQSFTWLTNHLDGNTDPLEVIYKEIEEESGLRDVEGYSYSHFYINEIQF